ncbi:MAG: class I SAM-dependent methyltransferase [Opitutales bacterium]
MQRRVEPEILDQLPFDDPVAQRNRRDIARFNSLMGNFRWIRDQLAAAAPLPFRGKILELGAGLGDLALHLRDQGIIDADTDYRGLDICPRPDAWPDTWTWHQEDLLAFERTDGAPDLIVANLILHQFETGDLGGPIGRLCRSATRIIAAETARRRRHRWQLPLAVLLGMHPVSFHDARVSIQGGFRHNELPQLLGLTGPAWQTDIKHTFLGGYRMTAHRVS